MARAQPTAVWRRGPARALCYSVNKSYLTVDIVVLFYLAFQLGAARMAFFSWQCDLGLLEPDVVYWQGCLAVAEVGHI